jgi:hypothetical protein
LLAEWRGSVYALEHLLSCIEETGGAQGTTWCLSYGSRRDLAQQMAAHESPRTTALYDRRDDEVAVDPVRPLLKPLRLSKTVLQATA